VQTCTVSAAMPFIHAAVCCVNSVTRHESHSSKREARTSNIAGAEHKERLTSQASEFAKTFQEELKKGSEEIFKNPPPPPRK
jgi:ABC-type phosphate/phosphonate transport system substrate-binding protein